MRSLSLSPPYRANGTNYASKTGSRIALLVCSFLFGSCFYVGKNQLEDIVERPSSEWSSRDCLTIMMGAISHNIFDQYSPNVKVIATPYYPSVITALNRTDQRVKHLSEEQYRSNMDQQFQEDLGLYVDWKELRLVDGNGNYYKSVLQIDTVTFLITIENKNWPCVSPLWMFGGVITPLLGLADYPCYTPDIGHLEDSIYLYNDRGQFVRAKSVWGRQRSQLTMEETLLAKFLLRDGEQHFLTGVRKMYLGIEGFDAKVKLEFPVRLMEKDFRQF